MLLILVSLCGLISCVSQHKHLLVHLSCHSITKTKQGPFSKQYLWASTDRITGAKCKGNWTRAAWLKENGGLGILHLGKFTRALHFLWLWRDWNPEGKPWVGSELPCNETDKHLFAAATTIKIGNGKKIAFWNSAWMQGLRPRNLAASVYTISRKKTECYIKHRLETLG